MKVKLKNGRRASEEAIVALETVLGRTVSHSFRIFVQTYDGAEPETNTFRISEDNDSGVNEFIPTSKILNERAYVRGIPTGAYPVAWAEGGNYVFVDEGQSGAVYYWDHELTDGPVTRLASDFDTFLNLLEPFDIRTIKLKPDQVEKVWIDPEFLKSLKK
jgi:hypothetical protein